MLSADRGHVYACSAPRLVGARRNADGLRKFGHSSLGEIIVYDLIRRQRLIKIRRRENGAVERVLSTRGLELVADQVNGNATGHDHHKGEKHVSTVMELSSDFLNLVTAAQVALQRVF